LMLLGTAVGVEIAAACPAGYQPDEAIVREAGELATVGEDPREAARGAHALYTDVWVSMGDEAEAAERRAALAPYRLDEELLAEAREDAIVLHCLPAHPGEEITEGLLYGERSAVWDQAENRLHTQKALLEYLLD
jgi:ornithine carbamoyltransferase